MPTPWLITREADDARVDREVFDARGVPVIEVPCVETRWRAWPWSSADGLTLFTSRRAVSAWERAGKPGLADVAAVSPSTSRALEELGVTPSLAIEGGVVPLAEAIVARWHALGRPATQVRYPTSGAGLTAPEQQRALELLSALGPVARQVVYEVQPPRGLAQALDAATRFDWAITFASPSAVSHFFAAVSAPRPPRHVVCVGRSTARAWNELRPASWPGAVVSSDLRSTIPEVIP